MFAQFMADGRFVLRLDGFVCRCFGVDGGGMLSSSRIACMDDFRSSVDFLMCNGIHAQRRCRGTM